jgi:SWI/SNF-related matrix-associated actin-dependent regulator 1 of chromatin subfamily A
LWGILLKIALNGAQLTVAASYKYGDTLRPLGFVWDARTGLWVYQNTLNPSTLTALEDAGVEIPVELRNLITSEHVKVQELCALQHSSDVSIVCGDGIDPYQRVGVKFLVTAKRALLADAPGIGKSAQAIRAVCEAGANNVLIVAKKSLIYNWHQQVRLWATHSFTCDITNYEQILSQDKYFKQKYNILIIDEATAVKNRYAKRTKALTKLARKIPYVWLLTGTPILNRPDELWSLLHIIDPKQFNSYWTFVNRYCATEFNYWANREKPVGIKPGMAEVLAQDLSTVMLRRERNVIDLPPITFETVYVQLEGIQEKLYRSMEKDFFVYLESVDELCHAASVGAQLVRLQQLNCSPALVGGPDQSAKDAALLDIVTEYAENHKLLVFTTFVPYANMLCQKLAAYKPVLITGATSLKSRQSAVDMFNANPECRVMIGTIGAIGEGMNIQAADMVVFINKPWVPAIVDQAISRAHRRGQKKPVHVISLHAVGTIDDYIESVLSSKEAVISEFDIIARMMADYKKGGVADVRAQSV